LQDAKYPEVCVLLNLRSAAGHEGILKDSKFTQIH